MRSWISGFLIALLLFSTFQSIYSACATKSQPLLSNTDNSLSKDNFLTLDNLNETATTNPGNPVGDSIFDQNLTVVEHKISPSELANLEKKIGVYTEGLNYNIIVDGPGTGERPPTEQEWAEIAQNGLIAEKAVAANALVLPSLVDHTTDPWFPPIGDQGQQNSCTAWAVAYYMKTYQEAKEHNWNLSAASWDNGQPTAEYQSHIISPSFVYNLINGGMNTGTSSMQAIYLICSLGASSWEKMQYEENNCTVWPSEEAWKEAPLYRGASSGDLIMDLSTDHGILSLKNLIAAGDLAKISVDGDKFPLMTSNDVWTLDNYVNPITNHANTVVGYDDNIAYQEQGSTRHGAFKIANSWGSNGKYNWEHVLDGCYWISYEAMKQRVSLCEYYLDRIGYQPQLISSFRIDHSKRGECSISIGVETYMKSFQFISGGDQPFCPNDIFLDITDVEENIPDIYGQQFVLKVTDGGSSTTGTILKFSVEYAQSNSTPIQTVNGGTVNAYVTLTPLETNWSDEKQINPGTDLIDSDVSLATDSKGFLYVAYDDWLPSVSQYAVFVKRSLDEGRTWQELSIASDPSHNIRHPSIAIDPYSDNVFVAVEREWTPDDHDIFVWRCINGLWSWSAVANTLGNNDRFPSITCEYQYGSLDWLYISYEYVYTYNDRDLMFAKSTDHGSTWSIKKLHGDFPDYNVHAQTSITNGEGNIYIAYKWGADYDTPCEIRVDRSTDFGSSWSQFTHVDGLPNGCTYPSIAASHGGDSVVVAFQYAWSPSDTDVWYSYSTDKGTNWKKALPLFDSGLENEKSPKLTVDGGGTTGNNVQGDFHVVCKVGSYVEYAKAACNNPSFWMSYTLISDTWVGNGLSIATQYRNNTSEFHPCVAWNDERSNGFYFSTVGHVHDLTNGLKYDSIQDAINSPQTSEGDTILVESRTYSEVITLSKSVSLIGEDKEDTVILGKPNGNVVDVSSDNCVLSNFTIKGGSLGINVHDCSNVTIQNNCAAENEAGLTIRNCSNVAILYNNITLNSLYGIRLLSSSGCLLKNNTMIANQYNFGIQGDNVSHFLNDIDTSNSINEKPLYYFVRARDLFIEGSTFPQIGYLGIVDSTNVTLQNIQTMNNIQGLLLAYTNSSTIVNCTLSDNEMGIMIDTCSDNSFISNHVADNQEGLYLLESANNVFRNNSMLDNKYNFGVEGSTLSDVLNDVDTSNTIGGRPIYYWINESGKSVPLDASYVALVDCTGTTVQDLNLTNNIQGIVLACSTNTTVSENTIADNLCGISVYESINCLTVHNNFLNNSQQVSVRNSSGNWDNGYPAGGNYWSDYNCTDLYWGRYQNETGSDNIGDACYCIDTKNLDNYPLAVPWVPFENGTIHIRTDGLIQPSGAPIYRAGDLYTLGCNFESLASGIVVEKDNVVLDGAGYTILGTNNLNFNGIYLSGVHNVTIKNFDLENFSYAINLDSASGNNILDNYIEGNFLGIGLSYSSNNSIVRNAFVNDGLWVGDHSLGNVVMNNTVNSKDLVYLESAKDCEINDAGQVVLVECSNVRIENLDLSNSSIGVELWKTNNSLILNDRFECNIAGVAIYESFNDTLTANDISNNTYFGIGLFDSSTCWIYGNSIAENNGSGLGLSFSYNNSIHHNDFLNNEVQTTTYPSGMNSWDNGYPSGGNYWSDYNGSDSYCGTYQNETGSDSIGDTPYSIGIDSRDNYPLMSPYPFPDIAVTSPTPSKTIVGQGFLMNISWTVQNRGNGFQNSTTMLYANGTLLFSGDFALSNGSAIAYSVTWNTTEFARGNYTLFACVDSVLGDKYPADNNCTCNVPIHVGVPGDVSSATLGVYDGITNMRDVAYMIVLFNTRPSSVNWNPNADVNNDGVCNMRDIAIAILYFNQRE